MATAETDGAATTSSSLPATAPVAVPSFCSMEGWAWKLGYNRPKWTRRYVYLHDLTLRYYTEPLDEDEYEELSTSPKLRGEMCLEWTSTGNVNNPVAFSRVEECVPAGRTELVKNALSTAARALFSNSAVMPENCMLLRDTVCGQGVRSFYLAFDTRVERALWSAALSCNAAVGQRHPGARLRYATIVRAALKQLHVSNPDRVVTAMEHATFGDSKAAVLTSSSSSVSPSRGSSGGGTAEPAAVEIADETAAETAEAIEDTMTAAASPQPPTFMQPAPDDRVVASAWFHIHAAASRPERLCDLVSACAAGTDLNIPNSEGATPFVQAAGYGNLPALFFLLATGASVNTANPSTGNTALHLASANGHVAAVHLLVQQGAALLPNAAGQSPRDLAVSSEVRALLDAGQ